MDGRRTDNTMAKRKGQEKFEDVKDVIRSHRWKKDRQHNGQNKKDKKSLKMSKR
jgi:hypothetical protein